MADLLQGSHAAIKEKMVAGSGPMRMHLTALHAAAWYVCAERLCASNRHVLTDIGAGISSAMAAVFSKDGIPTEISQFMYELFVEYSRSLSKELNDQEAGNPFDLGATASLLINYFAKQLNIDEVLVQNPTEKLRLMFLGSASGIVVLQDLLLTKAVRYRESVRTPSDVENVKH